MPTILLTFPNGKHKALTMSYDDGVSADRRLVELFNEHRIKGTFHINSGWLGNKGHFSEEEAKQLYDGHEVAAHTRNHPTIARCPKEQLVYEFFEDRKHLESVFGYPIRGLSYPNGSYNKQIKELLPHLGFEYARVVQPSGIFSLPDDPFEWKPTCHHNDRLMEYAETFMKTDKKHHLHLMYVWGHSYEFDNDDNWDLIESFCEYVGSNDDIWYATNIEIIDYLQAFRNLKFTANRDLVWNPSATTVWLQVDGHIIQVNGGQHTNLI